jgi:adenylosuccinate lyase
MSLMALSSLDGRYASAIEPLTPFFSEYALIRYRVMVEIRWLQHLSQELEAVRAFTKDENAFLDGLLSGFSLADGEAIKLIEKTTNHDVKAVEYWIKRQLENTSLADTSEWVHFACTSEDINNLSHALMLKEGIGGVIIPRATQFVDTVATVANSLLYPDARSYARANGLANNGRKRTRRVRASLAAAVEAVIQPRVSGED